ncbi:uncharacterized protein [Drosophila takahashii]|uniref:uncharacterized protein n=1 Tax=Drosophila takahashii TaxID=29030 RepID=UPI003899026A
MAEAEAKAALTKFVAVTDRVSQFEARVNTPTDPPPSVHTNKVRLQQIQALWDKVEKEYETCSEVISVLNCPDTMEVMQAKYDYCYSVFERCAATLNETIERACVQPIHEPSTPVSQPSGCRVPPIDWFESAWGNLQTHFENKRLLVNSQLKILFNLPTVSQECGNSLKHLESTVQGCLTALKIAKVDTTNWDCLLVYLCSSKLPKLTLALWEQSLLNPSEIPGWEEFKNFLKGRHRTLEAIEEFKPTLNTQSRAPRSEARLSVTESQLDGILTKFWEVEDVPVKPGKESSSVCENNFQQTTTRDKDGRNEARLNKNVSLREQYDSVIQEYLDLGHMHLVSPKDDSSNFYLPHHAVFKPDSTTTKVHVVFNASNKSSNGYSLNDILHTSPVLQSDLTTQILKWRFFRYVFNADITKMYRQILVHPDHTRFQRILCRDKEGKLCDYELNTVTFGVNCAPFLAIRVLQQLSQDVRDQYPLASDIISNFMYVDDVLAGAHTQQSAVSAIKELCGALESAGFPLRKWTSNEKKLLQGIPKEDLIRADFLELEDASMAKTLGIRWHATSDSFFFLPMDISLQTTYTKREVLSQIAKLFDPAGWLSPVIVRAKIFMQEIWLRELSWDQPLPVDLVTKWRDFLKGYPTLKEVRIPRWVKFHPDAKLQYHGFCDASQSAYGAAIFVRVETSDGCFTQLLVSKTRVAPVKSLSIPRLELCGAVLLSELAAAVLSEMPPTQYETYYWTDSTIVLAWLSKPACTWTTFVANRVAKVHQLTNREQWFHVISEDNPADLASRGVSVHELRDSNLWWHGPEWLRHNREQWPLNSSVPLETELEQRPIRCNVAKAPPKTDPLERFSAFERALRVLAYVFRFARLCRKQDVNVKSELTAAELSNVQERLIVLTQRNEYPTECKALGKKQNIPVSSTISNLNPFVDSHGVLRASGRLRASEMLSYDEKHPIIIPARCTFAKLLVLFTHRISLHGGNQLMIRLIRSKYWIPQLRNLVKVTIHACRVCTIHKQKLQTQLMGDLPCARSTFSRAFTHTGVDFAGPFDIKNYVGRGCKITKGYVCVFVCFSTRAIHLEATSDLTTEKFLAAFSRFSARRGCPQHIHSDNGKTFVGASTSLSKDFIEATRSLILSNYSLQNVTWHFNPPAAPHMGGLWEAGVKSFKAHFYKHTAGGKYTFEELATLLSKIEACLNSRPISPMSEDPTDLVALSPGHFLVGGPLLSVAEPEIKENPISILNRWRRLKALHQQFCLRWKEEYLKELHKRTKWQFPTRNIQTGDMVVLKEENLPPNEWRLGRIQLVCPGADGKTRVAEVLTARGIIRRPIAKMIRLPMEASSSE